MTLKFQGGEEEQQEAWKEEEEEEEDNDDESRVQVTDYLAAAVAATRAGTMVHKLLRTVFLQDLSLYLVQ